MEALVSICVQIIDLIADKKASDTESVRKIRKALELLKSHDALASEGGIGGVTSTSGTSSPRPPPPPRPPSGEYRESPSKRPRVS
mmetsp:Transcript_17822/g.37264  ORF Transcript_17822/g.37264 Transcript_17822/m.37264 type:complete len:85 (-) Transcript_17822:123-377(-)